MTKLEFKQQAALALLSNASVHTTISGLFLNDLVNFTDAEKGDNNKLLLQQRAFAYYVSGIVDEIAAQLDHSFRGLSNE